VNNYISETGLENYQQKGEKKISKAWVGLYWKLFGKGDAAYYFLRSCSCL